jgi:hypothetical protein
MKRSIRIGLLLVILLSVVAFVAGVYPRVFPPAKERLAEWATPVESTALKNFFHVSEELFRGAEPDGKGLQELKRMGVRTVINLKKNNSQEDQVRRLGMEYEHIGMNPMHAKKEDVARFLRLFSIKAAGRSSFTASTAPIAPGRCAPSTASRSRVGPRSAPSPK